MGGVSSPSISPPTRPPTHPFLTHSSSFEPRALPLPSQSIIHPPTHPPTHLPTFSSVGFGDHVPATQQARLFTIFFAVVGISIIALAVGEISGFIIERQVSGWGDG